MEEIGTVLAGKKKRARLSSPERYFRRVLAEQARSYLERELKPVLNTYIALATGRSVTKGGKKLKLDPATTRHYVERFIGQAPRSTSLGDLAKSVEDFLDELESEAAANATDVTDDGQA